MLLASLMLFPATLFWMSPYIIIDGAAHGVVNGSAFVFAGMLMTAVVLGRAWCGWLCPAGALQDQIREFRTAQVPRGYGRIKWVLWGAWLAGLATAAYAGGVHRIDPFYHLEWGVTFMQPGWWVVYFVIITLFGGLALAVGRRGACHTICWMAPFMVVGGRLGRWAGTPRLRLSVDNSACTECGTCSDNCPMSLNVRAMVAKGDVTNDDCVLCGTCVEGCRQGVLSLGFASSARGAPRRFPRAG